MVISDYVEKNGDYRPSGVGIQYDGGLGEDIIALMSNWQRLEEERQENYVMNRVNNKERGQKSIPKSKASKKEIPAKKKAIVVGSLVIGGLIALGRYQAAGYITSHVLESGIIPEGLSKRDDSQAGLIFSYLDKYGNRQTMNGEYFIQMAVQNGKEKGFSPDQVAIALDHYGICNASAVADSSLLGRIGQELIAGSELLSVNQEQTTGRSL